MYTVEGEAKVKAAEALGDLRLEETQGMAEVEAECTRNMFAAEQEAKVKVVKDIS